MKGVRIGDIPRRTKDFALDAGPEGVLRHER
jgi:hypothetical protein